MENILEHEDVEDIRNSARATARQMTTKGAAVEKGHTSTVEGRRADSAGREKGVENAAFLRRHPLGHRNGTRGLAQMQRIQVCQRREQVQSMERRISESCGPARGDEGVGGQDKVVLSAGAGARSADRVAMAYRSDGGAMPT